jgi:RNA polymerase sigma-B factor
MAAAPALQRPKRSKEDRARRQRQDQNLMHQHRGGNGAARTELIERYMPLARSLALRYRRASEPLDDLIQVASVGLVKAVDRWDPDRGLAFSSYAVPTILGELRRYFRDSTWDVRPARDMQELCLAVEEARDALWIDLGHSPTVGDLASHLGRPQEEVLEALQATEGRSLRSLDAPVHEEEGDSASAGELIGSEDPEYDRVDAGVTFERLSGVLDDRAREILRLRFAEDLLQSEIAERVGCSQMHVSRIIRASLEKLYQYAGMTTTLEVPQPAEPATPVVPDAPTVPADPTPSRETPDTPTGPDTPSPDDPLPPQPDGPSVPDPAEG